MVRNGGSQNKRFARAVARRTLERSDW